MVTDQLAWKLFVTLSLALFLSSRCGAFTTPTIVNTYKHATPLSRTKLFAPGTHTHKLDHIYGSGRRKHPKYAQMSVTPLETDGEVSNHEDEDEDNPHTHIGSNTSTTEEELEQEDQETNDLILDFAHRIEETTVGNLEEEDFNFIRPILRELESFSERGLGIDGDDTLVAEITEKLVGRLTDEWQYAIVNDVEIDFEPDISFFNIALNAWVHVENKENHDIVYERMYELWDEVKDLYDSGLELCKPDTDSFNAMLSLISSKKGKGGSSDAAMDMYQEMKASGVVPSSDTFEILIEITTRSKSKDSAQAADDLIRQGVAMFPPKSGGIGISSFNAVLSSWAKSNERDSSTSIERILGLMDEHGVKPDVRSFTIYIDSFAQQTDYDAVQESDNILSKLVDLFLSGQLDFEPDVTCWTTVIRGWMRLAKRTKKAAFKAEDLLERMIVLHDDGKITCEADKILYTSVLKAHVLAGFMWEAERVLTTMEYLWKQGDEEMKPSVKVLNTVIEGWVRSPQEEAMERAEAIFYKVLQLHEEECDDDMVSGMYRSLLFGYSKRDNPTQAEKILRVMIEKNMKVDSFCFDKVVDGYKSLGDEEKIKNVYPVFELLESCQKQGILQANERVYTSIIRAIAKESKPGMVKKSQTIIRRMQQLYKGGNADVSPTIFTYNAMLAACANSVKLESAERSAAFNAAIEAFNLLRSSDELSPDHVTYSVLIKCSHLLPEGEKRNNLLVAISKQCAQNEFVDERFLRILEEYAPEALSKKLLLLLNTRHA